MYGIYILFIRRNDGLNYIRYNDSVIAVYKNYQF